MSGKYQMHPMERKFLEDTGNLPKEAKCSESAPAAGLSCEGCKDNGPHDENCKLCFTCDGAGVIRANYTDDKGLYTFHKKPCDRCGGTGLAR